MNLKPLLDGVANGDLKFIVHPIVSMHMFDCTDAYYDRMVDPNLGDCYKCPFFNHTSYICTLPLPAQLKHHIPYLREHHPELFI